MNATRVLVLLSLIALFTFAIISQEPVERRKSIDEPVGSPTAAGMTLSGPILLPSPPQPPELSRPAQESLSVPSENIVHSESLVLHQQARTRQCIATPTHDIPAAGGNRIYHWRDDRGQMHYSDRPPADMPAEQFQHSLPQLRDYFKLKLSYPGRNQVPFLQGNLSAGMTGIFSILAELVGEDSLRQVELNLKIFPDRRHYLQYASGFMPTADNTGGFYTAMYNEAVTYSYSDDANTLRVARHEGVHVIMAALFGAGTVPLWLNEGMAEYFELLEMQGQISEIPVNTGHLQLALSSIESGYPANLNAFMNLGAEHWQGSLRNTHYALAWGLVFFLMDSDRGQAALSQLLQVKAEDYCGQVNHELWLAGAYPGGVQGLQRDFYRWLQASPAQRRHRY